MASVSWTDCKSLHDCLHKEGSIPTERRIALDVYDIRQYLDTDDLLWTSTNTMLVDPLTKHFSKLEETALREFLLTGFCQPTLQLQTPS